MKLARNKVALHSFLYEQWNQYLNAFSISITIEHFFTRKLKDIGCELQPSLRPTLQARHFEKCMKNSKFVSLFLNYGIYLYKMVILVIKLGQIF